MSYSEKDDLEHLANSDDPTARVIYHMSMRQLAMLELLQDTQDAVIRVEGEVRRLQQSQARVADYVDKYLVKSNGSKPRLAAVLGFAEPDGGE